jgi:hypothetical protein
MAMLLGGAPADTGAAMGPLSLCAANPRYFADAAGAPIYLAGAHDGWELQDYAWGDQNPGVLFDWPGFLDFQAEHNHNVIRMWVVEHTKINDADPDLTTPMPYRRVAGHGQANDGGGKFDLDQLNDEFFDRLRSRTTQGQERGIYVIVMLFQGWSIEDKGGRVNPWPYHPFHAANNINGVDGDLNGDGKGTEVHTWLGEDHPITQRQRAYVRRVIDTVGHLDNVLYEIANESSAYSTEWQYRMIDYIRQYEAEKPKQHPIGMTFQHQGGSNATLFESPADWVSPNREGGYRDNPPPADGRKVVLSDTDHLFGAGCKDYRWVWKTFCRGHNVLYMDMWTVERDDPDREKVRRAIGHTRRFAGQMDLKRTVPRPELASTKYCLVNPGQQYLVYLPEGGAATVDLSDAEGELAVEWFSPSSGETTVAAPISGRAGVDFAAPFPGDAVLYLARGEA